MTLQPLLTAPLAIQIHTVAALALIPLTLAQFIRPKAGHHAARGWAWIAVMAVVIVTSFFIHTIRLIGPFSPIHLLSIVTTVSLVLAVRARKAGDIARHQRIMIWVTAGWAIAGLFTLLPFRTLGQVLFG
jgi:uncharacterized membrane protein